MLVEKISFFEFSIRNHKIYKQFQIQRETFMDPLTLDHEILEENMEGFSSCAHYHQYLEWEIWEDLPQCHHLHQFLLHSFPSSSSTCKSEWWCGSYCTMWSNGRVLWCWIFFCFYDWMKTIMQWSFLLLKLNIPNTNNFCFCTKQN